MSTAIPEPGKQQPDQKTVDDKRVGVDVSLITTVLFVTLLGLAFGKLTSCMVNNEGDAPETVVVISPTTSTETTTVTATSD